MKIKNIIIVIYLFCLFSQCLNIQYSPLDTSQPGIAGTLALALPGLLELESTTNNSSPGVRIVEEDGTTTAIEGGAGDRYTMVLTSQPSSDVTITISPDAQVRVNGGTSMNLVFTPENWNTTQLVTMTALEDNIPEGTHLGNINHSVSSEDTNYRGLTLRKLVVSIKDSNTQIFYVRQSAMGASTGVSWEDAFTNLQTAVTTAGSWKSANPGTRIQVWVAEGTYLQPSSQAGDLTVPVMVLDMANGVEIYGGFVGTESSLAGRAGNMNLTILSGDFDSSGGASADDTCHVVRVANDSILDGFRIIRGNARTGCWSGRGAAGLVIGNITNARLMNITLDNNVGVTSSQLGITNSQNIIIGNTRFLNGNSAAVSTSGTTTVSFINTIFKNNGGTGQGGAIYSLNDASITVMNSTFQGNTNNTGQFIYTNGGACNGTILITNGSSLRVFNSVFHGNTTAGSSRDICSAWQGATANVSIEVRNNYYTNINANAAPATFVSSDNFESGVNPFQIVGDDVFLATGSIPIDAGSIVLADDNIFGFPSIGLDWRNLSTLQSGLLDTGIVDMGMHF